MRIFAVETIYRSTGNRIPGVDGEILTKEKLLDHVKSLTRNNLVKYKPSPIKRVFIPKPEKGEMRQLGIPTIRDRIVQTLFVQILEPVIDPHADKYSFGYRKGRSAHQAIGELARILHVKPQLFRGKKKVRRPTGLFETRRSAASSGLRELDTTYFSYTKYIYPVDIKNFFDSVSHEFLLNNYPMPPIYRGILKA